MILRKYCKCVDVDDGVDVYIEVNVDVDDGVDVYIEVIVDVDNDVPQHPVHRQGRHS